MCAGHIFNEILGPRKRSYKHKPSSKKESSVPHSGVTWERPVGTSVPSAKELLNRQYPPQYEGDLLRYDKINLVGGMVELIRGIRSLERRQERVNKSSWWSKLKEKLLNSIFPDYMEDKRIEAQEEETKTDVMADLYLRKALFQMESSELLSAARRLTALIPEVEEQLGSEQISELSQGFKDRIAMLMGQSKSKNLPTEDFKLVYKAISILKKRF